MSAPQDQLGPSTSRICFELIYPRPGAQIFIDQDPIGRSGHSMVCDDSNVYIFGGFNPQGRPIHLAGRPSVLEELWKFSLASLKWTKLETTGFPSTCASSSLSIRGNKLYAFGGTAYPFGQLVTNTLKVCDLGNPERGLSGGGSGTVCRWEDVLEFTDPAQNEDGHDSRPPRGYGQSLIFHNNYIYIFGGAVGFYTEAINDLHRLNLVTHSWEKMEPQGDVPEGRYKQEIIKDTDRFYIVGGGRLHSAQPIDILYSYTFCTNCWNRHELQPHPAHGTPMPRNAFGFVQMDRDVYICGGQCYGNGQTVESLCDMWHLNMDDRVWQWRRLPVDLPERMYFHRSVVTCSKHLYIFGGVLDNGRRSQKMWRYKLPNQAAKLSEMCWYLITTLCTNLKDTDPRILREILGIPQRFIDRL